MNDTFFSLPMDFEKKRPTLMVGLLCV